MIGLKVIKLPDTLLYYLIEVAPRHKICSLQIKYSSTAGIFCISNSNILYFEHQFHRFNSQQISALKKHFSRYCQQSRLNKNIVPIKPLPLDFFLHENEIPTFITRPLNHSILWYLIKNAIVHHCDFESRKKVLRGKML